MVVYKRIPKLWTMFCFKFVQVWFEFRLKWCSSGVKLGNASYWMVPSSLSSIGWRNENELRCCTAIRWLFAAHSRKFAFNSKPSSNVKLRLPAIFFRKNPFRLKTHLRFSIFSLPFRWNCTKRILVSFAINHAVFFLYCWSNLSWKLNEFVDTLSGSDQTTFPIFTQLFQSDDTIDSFWTNSSE